MTARMSSISKTTPMRDHLSTNGLIPILVAGYGRSGTTALMSLLGADERIAFDRRYPYENRWLTYLTKFAQLAVRPGASPTLNSEQLCEFSSGTFGSVPWPNDPTPGPPPLAPSSAEWLAGMWTTFSSSVREQNLNATHYAEKAPAWLPAAVHDVIPAKAIHLVRDPRDVFLSAAAFNRARGGTGFGQRIGDSDLDHARNLAYELLLYHENRNAVVGLDVRYEDLIADPRGTVERISSHIGLDLPVGAAQDAPADHFTSMSPEKSIGRWKREQLPPGVRTILESQLDELLLAHGYERCEPSPIGFDTARCTDCSSDGHWQPQGFGAHIQITGEDFWVALPPQEFAAKAVQEIWACVRADTGDHCSLYWRRGREEFHEGRSVHAAWIPGPHWQIVRFRLSGHEHWHGTIAQIRLDLFNGPNACGSGELRWIRRVI
jgi:hypothetical protein